MSKSHLCCCSWSLLHTGWQHTHLCLHYNINTTHVELIPPALAPIICCLFYISYQELETFTATQVFPLAMMSTTCVSSLTGFITARCYASAVLAMGLCLSVCLSVTSRSSTKTAKHRITQTTPQDSPGTPVFCSDAKDIREIRPGSPTTRAPNAGEVGQYRRLLTNNRLHLETGTR